MAKRPTFMDDLSKAAWRHIEHGVGRDVDKSQQQAIDHLTQHVRVLWNHIERLEKMLSVGNRPTPAPPVPHNVAITTAGDGDITAMGSLALRGENHASLHAGRNLSLVSGTHMKLTSNMKFEVVSGDRMVMITADEVNLQCGSAQLHMKKDGSISLKGKDITVDGSGRINIKAAGEVAIRGAKVSQV